MASRLLLAGLCLLLAMTAWPSLAMACPFCRADAAGLGAAAAAPSDASAIQVSGGLDIPSAFYFRGYLQASHGPILQPYLNIFTNRVFDDGVVVRPYVSMFHSANMDDANRMADMSDVMAGAVATGYGFSVDARYAWYTMNQFMRSAVHEFGVKASYDLVSLCSNCCCAPSPFSFRPFVGVYCDLFDDEGTEDVFINVGFEPSWRCELGCYKIGLGLPTDWGLSGDGYYLDSDGSNAALGYFSTALTMSVLLPIDCPGQWFLNTSVQYLHLAADSVRAVAGGDTDVCIGKLGVSFVF